MYDNEHLKKLNELLKSHNLDAYIIFTSDPHNSEYISDEFLSLRKYFCPFSGSAGQVVVTQSEAYLFADGRYWIQAEKELSGTPIKLIKLGDKDAPSLIEFLKEKELNKIGVDKRLITQSYVKTLQNNGFIIADLNLYNEFDIKFSKNESKLFKLNDELVTLTHQEKINKIYQEMDKVGATSHLITTLDDIAYILNVRGNDIPNNPVFYSYLYLSKKFGNYLFVDKNKIDFEIEGVKIFDYNSIESFLMYHQEIPTLVDSIRCNAFIYNLLLNPIEGKNPSYVMKAIKGEKEIKNTKEIQAIDGIALLKFSKYLKDNIKNNLTEFEYSEKLKEFRLSNSRCFDLSFGSIVAFGENAAQMHYAPTFNNSSIVNDTKIELLVDSGGQYFGGTTDTTRTFIVGEPTQEFKHDYTLTLKALINLSNTIFLKGSTGQTIDIRAREYFWREGMDYKCGTGHGVGYILNVHEGPNGFRYRKVVERDDQGEIVPGMITTIEPGVYKANKYGIRIENNLLCVKSFETEDGEFYKFETITYVPIDKKGLDLSMLSKEEIEWINSYHKMVYEKLSPLIKEESLCNFLKEQTSPISIN